MIGIEIYLAFVLVSAGIIVMPGPNVLLIMATSVSHGYRRGLHTVAGTSAAMALQLVAATAMTASLAALMASWFSLIKWLGVAYLVYLGIRHMQAALYPAPRSRQVSGSGTFWRGFMVSLTNPKTILFFGAFLPQFIDPQGGAVLVQTAALSATFLCLAVVLDSCYALAAGALRHVAGDPRLARWRDGATSFLFIGAGLGLALTRRG